MTSGARCARLMVPGGSLLAFMEELRRMILFGQSEGAASVDFHSYAWTSNPIATEVISKSGTAFSWGLPHAAAEVAIYWFNVTATMGCGNASSNATEVLACM